MQHPLCEPLTIILLGARARVVSRGRLEIYKYAPYGRMYGMNVGMCFAEQTFIFTRFLFAQRMPQATAAAAVFLMKMPDGKSAMTSPAEYKSIHTRIMHRTDDSYICIVCFRIN